VTLIELLNAYAAYLKSLDPCYVGNGDGKLVVLFGTDSRKEETITCQAIDAKHFSVSGSVSGSLGTATLGRAFTSSVANFMITAGLRPWTAGDVIQLVMTPSKTLRFAEQEENVFSELFRQEDACREMFRKALAANRAAIENHRNRKEWN
jgi:hypothetical protein